MSQRHYLVIGSGGMLGRAWSSLLAAQQAIDPRIRHTLTHRPQLDLTDPDSISRGLNEDVDVVVNCAAWTDVDGAEDNEAEATRVNGHAVGQLAQRCRQIDATLIHYSTDYVFDGQANAPYPTHRPLAPLNAYGRSKAAGELAVRDSGCDHLILRTSWLYAPWGKNFVLTIARLAQERETLKVVDDQRGRPSSVTGVADASYRLEQSGARGTFHVTDGDECTWYEFATAIAARVNPSCKVEPCNSAEYPRPAPRPAYSVLDLQETEERIGVLKPWRDRLAEVLARSEPTTPQVAG